MNYIPARPPFVNAYAPFWGMRVKNGFYAHCPLLCRSDVLYNEREDTHGLIGLVEQNNTG